MSDGTVRFESVEITNNTNKITGDAEQVGGVLLVATARGREKTNLRVGVRLVVNKKRRSTATSNPVHKTEK